MGSRPSRRIHQFLWFLALWAGGVLAVSAIGLLIRLVLH